MKILKKFKHPVEKKRLINFQATHSNRDDFFYATINREIYEFCGKPSNASEREKKITEINNQR